MRKEVVAMGAKILLRRGVTPRQEAAVALQLDSWGHRFIIAGEGDDEWFIVSTDVPEEQMTLLSQFAGVEKVEELRK